ncbi:hypothetical protein D3C81_410550 [compost metagenome]|jgi:hypothetical protein
MLIKKPVFPSVRAAASAVGSLALAPYSGDEVRREYVNRLEEFQVKDGDWETPFVCLWGEADFFFLYVDSRDLTTGKETYIIVDGVANDDPTINKYHDDMLHLIQRCMLVGYIPVVLMEAMADYGRCEEEMFSDFMNIFGELVDHVEDILEMFEVKDEA